MLHTFVMVWEALPHNKYVKFAVSSSRVQRADVDLSRPIHLESHARPATIGSEMSRRVGGAIQQWQNPAITCVLRPRGLPA